MRSVLREPAAPPSSQLGVTDIIDFGEGWQDPDAPTTIHRSARNTRAEDKPSLAPVSMRSDELIEVTHMARNNRMARVGYAAVFGATLVAALYVWRMQPQAAAQPAHVAAQPQPFIKEPAHLIASTAQPVIERAAEPAAVAADIASAEKTSAQAAADNQPASIAKHRSSKASKSETASEEPATAEQAPAATPASEPTQGEAPATAPQAEPQAAETAAATAPAEGATPDLPPFNQAAAQAALDAAAGRAAGCLKPGEPEGLARVVVTFAPSGHVTVASVDGPPFAGTPTGGCIARAFRSASIAPFSGKLMTVGKTVALR